MDNTRLIEMCTIMQLFKEGLHINTIDNPNNLVPGAVNRINNLASTTLSPNPGFYASNLRSKELEQVLQMIEA